MRDDVVTLDADQLHVHLLLLREGHGAPVHEAPDLRVLAGAGGDAEVEEVLVVEEDRIRGRAEAEALEHLELSLYSVPLADGDEVEGLREDHDEDLVLE